jgi:ATP-dependent Clp protease ATP-binding subunit ClpA
MQDSHYTPVFQKPVPVLCRKARLPFLLRFARDLTEEARQGLLEPVVGREAVMERMSQILLRKTKNNPVLLGDPGVGKTAVVEALAQAIANGRVGCLVQSFVTLS